MIIHSNSTFILVSGFNNRIIPEGVDDAQKEKPGIRIYGEIIGKILALFKFSVKLEAKDQNGVMRIWYCNRRSFENWMAWEKTTHHLQQDYDFSVPEVLDKFIQIVKKHCEGQKNEPHREEKPEDKAPDQEKPKEKEPKDLEIPDTASVDQVLPAHTTALSDAALLSRININKTSIEDLGLDEEDLLAFLKRQGEQIKYLALEKSTEAQATQFLALCPNIQQLELKNRSRVHEILNDLAKRNRDLQILKLEEFPDPVLFDLKHFPRLRSLEISDASHLNVRTFVNCTFIPELIALKLGGFIDHNNIKALADSSRFSRLKELDLSGIGLYNESVIALAESPNFPELETLNLGINILVEAEALNKFASFTTFPKLQKIVLPANYSSEEEVWQNLQRSQRMKWIQQENEFIGFRKQSISSSATVSTASELQADEAMVLSINRDKVSIENLGLNETDLIAFLARNGERIEYLALERSKEAQAINFLSLCPNIHALILKNEHYRESILNEIVNRDNSKLHKLEIANMSFMDIKPLTQAAVNTFANLETLIFADASHLDLGSLASSTSFPKLKQLEIRKSSLKKQEVMALASSTSFSELEVLHLGQNAGIDVEALKKLAAPSAFPKLKTITLPFDDLFANIGTFRDVWKTFQQSNQLQWIRDKNTKVFIGTALNASTGTQGASSVADARITTINTNKTSIETLGLSDEELLDFLEVHGERLEYLELGNITEERAVKYLSLCPNLNHLVLKKWIPDRHDGLLWDVIAERDNSKLHTLQIFGTDFPIPSQLANTSFTNLRLLEVSKVYYSDLKTLANSSAFPNLKILNISDTFDTAIKALAESTQFPNLEVLNLSKNHFLESNVLSKFGSFTAFPKLKQLILPYIEPSSPEKWQAWKILHHLPWEWTKDAQQTQLIGIPKLIPTVPTSEQIAQNNARVLSINANKIPIEDLGLSNEELMKFVETNGDRLEYLAFKNIPEYQAIEYLALCPNIQGLSLKTKKYGNNIVKSIASRDNTKLVSLKINKCKIYDEEIELLTTVSFPKLEVLNISDCILFSYNAVNALVSSQQFPELKKLDLAANDFTERSVETIVTTHNFPKLEELVLTGSDISYSNAKKFAKLEQFPNLKKVFIEKGAGVIRALTYLEGATNMEWTQGEEWWLLIGTRKSQT